VSPNRLKRLFRSIFTRKGSNGKYLRLFEDLDLTDQQKVLAVFQLEPEELPVLGCLPSSATGDDVLLLTTERVMWMRKGEITTVNLKDLVEVMVDFHHIAKRRMSLLNTTRLEITDRKGKQVIRLEPGAPFSGVWNVLLNVTLRNKRSSLMN
jgi:hypothetical protein